MFTKSTSPSFHKDVGHGSAEDDVKIRLKPLDLGHCRDNRMTRPQHLLYRA